MKNLIVLALFGAFAAPNPYPVMYRIEEVHTQKHLLFTSGWGAGNIVDSDGMHGFIYKYAGCSSAVAKAVEPGYFKGRWKSDNEFVVALKNERSGKVAECILQIRLEPFVYAWKDGNLTHAPRR